jgi:hypothetical protein
MLLRGSGAGYIGFAHIGVLQASPSCALGAIVQAVRAGHVVHLPDH